MRERDAEGRPVATRNAGAFLSPVGMIPVPSSLLDEQRERDGATAGAVMRISLTERTRWALAIAVAIAAWSLMAMALRLVLIATSLQLSPESRAIEFRIFLTCPALLVLNGQSAG